MPQDFMTEANGQPMSPQKLKSLQEQAKRNGEVFPYDMTTVYASSKLVQSNSLPEITKAGQPMDVHTAIAEKMFASGKATKDQPKEAQPTEEEIVKGFIQKIALAKTIDEVNALVPETEKRKPVKEAAVKRLNELAK